MLGVKDILTELRAARDRDVRTQEQLAADCGCTQGQVSRILNGQTKNMRGAAYRLCESLKIKLPQTGDFDLESHLSQIESGADSRQRELIHVIRHAYSRINISVKRTSS